MSTNNDAIKEITVRLDAGTLDKESVEYWLHQVLTDLAQYYYLRIVTRIIDGYKVGERKMRRSLSLLLMSVG